MLLGDQFNFTGRGAQVIVAASGSQKIAIIVGVAGFSVLFLICIVALAIDAFKSYLDVWKDGILFAVICWVIASVVCAMLIPDVGSALVIGAGIGVGAYILASLVLASGGM